MINFLDQNLLSQRLLLLKLAGVAGLEPMINFLDQNLLSQRLLLLKLAGVAGLEPMISLGSKPIISALPSIKTGWCSWTRTND